ncbi:hypothetical protein HCJ92_12085 [Streptomyces sp. ventii]|uniref:Lipoprotein n=2 Tax=Streptomyces spiramenti TaxID=2720606 RepID=A0ABX1AMY0_9ACTN|nr:hypothetical protein [Streptomyces spiramenti]
MRRGASRVRPRPSAGRRLRGAAALVLVGVVGLSGCAGAGGEPDAAPDPGRPSDALSVIRGVPDTLAAGPGSRVTTSLQLASGGTRIAIRGEGVFDHAAGVGELLVTLPEDPGAARAAPVTEVFVPGLLYMRNRGAGVPADKWVRVEIDSLPDGNLVTGGATDPVTAAELLRGAQAAEYHGEVELDGEKARLYSGVTDIAAASRAAGDEDRRRQLAVAVGAFTVGAVPFEVYLDERGTPRRMRHEFSFAATDGGAGPVEVVSVTELYDFGTVVKVRLPDEGDIYAGAVVVDQTEAAAG